MVARVLDVNKHSHVSLPFDLATIYASLCRRDMHTYSNEITNTSTKSKTYLSNVLIGRYILELEESDYILVRDI